MAENYARAMGELQKVAENSKLSSLHRENAKGIIDQLEALAESIDLKWDTPDGEPTMPTGRARVFAYALRTIYSNFKDATFTAEDVREHMRDLYADAIHEGDRPLFSMNATFGTNWALRLWRSNILDVRYPQRIDVGSGHAEFRFSEKALPLIENLIKIY